MFPLAFWTIAATALAGAGLAVLFWKPIWPRETLAAAVHGIVGTFGLAILALSLKTAAAGGRLVEAAAILTGLAWVAGLVLAFLPLTTRRGKGILIAGHGALALFGFAILAVYWLTP